MPPTPSRPLLNVARGLAMGSADVIPGVSGGTVALILGFYDQLVGGIRDVAAGLALLVRGSARGWARLRGAPWRLLLPLVAGIGVALAVGSVVLPPLLERYPVQMSALFFGLIAGSLPIPWAEVTRRTPGVLAVAVVAAVAAFLLVGLPEAPDARPGLLQVFASAAVAICAMILPGVSGAFLLLVLGMYHVTLEAVRDLDLGYIATFAAGAIVGLGAFSKLLSWLLTRRRTLTMAALVGLMAGSLRRLWPWGGVDGQLEAPGDVGEAAAAALLAVAGVVVVRVLARAGARHLALAREGSPAVEPDRLG